jgi:hypothetical protein
VIEALEANFNIGNVLKYIWRYKKKGGVDDLRKALTYLQREISSLGGQKVSLVVGTVGADISDLKDKLLKRLEVDLYYAGTALSTWTSSTPSTTRTWRRSIGTMKRIPTSSSWGHGEGGSHRGGL